MERATGRLNLVGRALEPIHHGGGTAGNTQILRTQRIYSETIGDFVKVPFVSGNSVKHLIRESAARFALDALSVEDGSLTKAIVHLLFSGGALGKSGSTVKLSTARRLEQLMPAISMCGYSAANNMQPSKLRTDHLHLVCRENAFRLPDDLKEVPEAQRPAAAYRGEEFGTRHEPTRTTHVAQRLLPAAEAEQDEKALDAAADDLESGKHREKQGGSAQMIYDFETVSAGSLWWGGLWFSDLTEMEVTALKTAFEYAARDKGQDGGVTMFVGAKASVGFGRMSFSFSGALRQPRAPEYNESNLPVPTTQGLEKPSKQRGDYLTHLVDRREDILALLAEVAV